MAERGKEISMGRLAEEGSRTSESNAKAAAKGRLPLPIYEENDTEISNAKTEDAVMDHCTREAYGKTCQALESDPPVEITEEVKAEMDRTPARKGGGSQKGTKLVEEKT